MRNPCRVLFAAAAAAALVLTPITPVQAASAPPLTVGMERAISVARPGNVQGEASAAWTNGVFFVVWEEFSPTGNGQVYGARVRPDGTVLDPSGILLSTRPDDSNVHPRVAGGAGRFLVVWQIDIEGTFSDLGAAMVTTGGRVTKQWGLSFVDNGQTAPDVAWNGRLFLGHGRTSPIQTTRTSTARASPQTG